MHTCSHIHSKFSPGFYIPAYVLGSMRPRLPIVNYNFLFIHVLQSLRSVAIHGQARLYSLITRLLPPLRLVLSVYTERTKCCGGSGLVTRLRGQATYNIIIYSVWGTNIIMIHDNNIII